MKKFLLLAFLSSFTIPAYCQIEADSIFIYKDFHKAGTTAGLQYNHRELTMRQAETVQFDKVKTDSLKLLFKETKQKRFFQQKHGGKVVYAIVWFDGQKYNYIIEGTDEFIRLVNLNTMRKWSLYDPGKVKALQELLKEN